MLYVFQVENGTMMTFEMRLALDTILNLKIAIAQKTDIPVEKQVLLISGGESLSDMQRVCSYSSAGTDTSPIFLFVKVNVDLNQRMAQISLTDSTESEGKDLMDVIESCMNMSPSLDTLVARTELAGQMNQQALHIFEKARRLVHEQHLQQQAWSAVTANLEDLTRAFKTKSDMFMSAFDEFSKIKPKYKELLSSFNENLKNLEETPILPTLIENKPMSMELTNSTLSSKSNLTSPKNANKTNPSRQSSKTSVPIQRADKKLSPLREDSKCKTGETDLLDNDKDTSDEFLDASWTESCPISQDKSSKTDDSNENGKVTAKVKQKTCELTNQTTSSVSSTDEPLMNLKQWIESHDNQNALKNLLDLCWRGLDRFSEDNVKKLRLEVQDVLKAANNREMMKIGAVGDRFSHMDSLMFEVKQAVEQQSELASSFNNHRESFSREKDVTVLPDLSQSHKVQLKLMLNNHEKVRDYRTKCFNSKVELCNNLVNRLRWIIFVEQRIGDLDDRLMMQKENLVRLQRRLQVVEQVHRAPELYLEAVAEALRRRRFSLQYLHWANSVAKISQELYRKELETRTNFDAKIGDHFLANLFPGLTRTYPPPFANQAPDPFDTKLPRITAADLQFLQSKLSENLAQKLQIPKEVPMPHIVYNNKQSCVISSQQSIHNNNNLPPEGQQLQQLEVQQPQLNDPIGEIPLGIVREGDDADGDADSLIPTPPSSPARQQQS